MTHTKLVDVHWTSGHNIIICAQVGQSEVGVVYPGLETDVRVELNLGGHMCRTITGTSCRALIPSDEFYTITLTQTNDVGSTSHDWVIDCMSSSVFVCIIMCSLCSTTTDSGRGEAGN